MTAREKRAAECGRRKSRPLGRSRRARLLHLFSAGAVGVTLAAPQAPVGVQVVNRAGPVTVQQVLKAPTRTYDVDKPPTRDLLITMCTDATLLLPKAPEEATFLGNEVVKFWSPSRQYSVEGRVAVLAASGSTATVKFSCVIVMVPRDKALKYVVRSTARF